MRSKLFVAVLMAVAMVSPAYAQTSSEITREQVDAALDRRREASGSLDEVTARFEEAISSEIVTRERIITLSKSVAKLEQEIGTKRVQVQDLIRDRYMSGGSLGTERIFTAETFKDIPVRSEYYELANNRDLALLHGLEAAEALYVEQQDQLDRTLEVQSALVVEIGELTEEIGLRLEQADAEYNSIAIAFEVQEAEKFRLAEEARIRREEAARKAAEEAARQATSTTVGGTTTTTTSASAATTTTSGGGETTTTVATETTTTTAPTTTTTTLPTRVPPVVTDGKTCPVNAATSFTDSWGAPRSGGRLHKGVDMMAARGAPIVAIESGTVTRTSDSSLGGISIYLTGASGNRYYYAHLESLADGVTGGTAVSVGDLVGLNGSSGNASYSAPHLHFQYAPPGGDWVNPYPLVKALCG
jgi:murein DD-endopeptidase MepM/ murein hydrolase activator NlpD